MIKAGFWGSFGGKGSGVEILRESHESVIRADFVVVVVVVVVACLVGCFFSFFLFSLFL